MEWDHADDTKSKSVTIKAEVSNVPYFCEAADIPGFDEDEHRYALVTLTLSSQEGREGTTEYMNTDIGELQQDNSKYLPICKSRIHCQMFPSTGNKGMVMSFGCHVIIKALCMLLTRNYQ